MPDAPPEPPAAAPDPRRWIPVLLGASALVLVPSILALVFLGARFRPLSHPQALEHAQFARNLAEGRGFSTSSLRPLSIAISPGNSPHPDLVNAPLHPLLLAAAFKIRSAADRVVAATGLILWCTSVPLVFLLARRAFGTGPAVLSTLFHASNGLLLGAALQGLPHPLLVLLVLTAGLLLLRPDPSPAAGGVVAALAALVHPAFFFHAALLLLCFAVARKRRDRATLVFLSAFVLVLLPWILRNLRLTGQPLFSLYWYEALAGTTAFPGDSVWRSGDAAVLGPLDFLFRHPLQSGRKILAGLLRFRQEAPQVLDPAVLILAASAIARGLVPARLAALLLGTLAAPLASCLFRAEPELLLAAGPLLAAAAGAGLADLFRRIRERLPMEAAWQWPLVRRLFLHPERARLAAALALSAAALAIAFTPLAHQLWVQRPSPPPSLDEAAALRATVPPDALVLTDQPGFVAWHAQRRAVWLCAREQDWDALESRGLAIRATYTSPAAAALIPAAGSGWLWWVTAPRGIYRDLVPTAPTPQGAILRVKR